MAFIYRPGLVGDANIQGTNSNDTIIAGPNDNTVSAKDGDDYVLGENGSDTLNGNKGNDFLFGENDNDTLNGNQDNDSLFGQSGTDSLTGGSGKDFLAGGIDADTLTGGDSADIFFFGSPFDEVSTTVDKITDFESGIDKIQVNSIEFNIQRTDFNKFSYVSSTGALLFEQTDSSTGLLEKTQFASLQPNLNFNPRIDISIV